jgi:phage-related tail fiber protein
MNYALILTNIGKAKIAQALANNTQINLLQISYGDGNGTAYEPNANMTSLKREVYRANIITRKLYPSDSSIIVLEAIVPINVGGWTIREAGVIDADNNLIAIAAHPEIIKPDPAQGSAAEMKTNIKLKVSDTAVINLTMPSSIYMATVEYVDDTKTVIETQTTEKITTLKKDVETMLTTASTTINSKQDEIPVFNTEGEFLIAEPELGSDTILLKLY